MKNVVIIGAGVAGVNAATKLIDNNFDGKITIMDMGKNPYERKYSEVMEGFLGAGGWSDGKLTYHTSIGGQLSNCLLYTSPSPRDRQKSRMPSSA